MNYSNYTLFEILKFKIEFLDCLEYGMSICETPKKEIKKSICYLKNNFENGTYKEIISTLFQNYQAVNDQLFDFFSIYPPRKAIKTAHSKKAFCKINYIFKMIDCYENISNIILAFTSEKEIKNKINKAVIDLININDEHFINFLYFTSFDLYINFLFPNKNKIKFKTQDLKQLISIIKYCNKNNLFTESIKILEESNEEKINREFERLSNCCINLENSQSKKLKEIVNQFNTEIQNNKK